MSKSIKTLNLALQGGGAHGALAWGIIDKLLEDGRIRFDSISATSAGAMNAAVLAHGLVSGGREGAREALYNFWKMISDAGKQFSPVRLTPIEMLLGVDIEHSMSHFLFDTMCHMLSPYEFNPFNVNPLREILEKCVDFERVQASKELKIFISATNVRTCKIQVFENKTFTLDAVMASACLPYLFQSVEVEGEYYWDGGFMGNPALYPIFYNCDSKDILILHINPIYREKIPKTAAEILNRMNEISFNSSLMREMRVISFVNKLLDNNWIKDERKKTMKRLFMHAIRADVTMQSLSVASKMNAEWSFINDLHHRGRIEAEEWIKNNFRLIGKQSSIDIEEYL